MFSKDKDKDYLYIKTNLGDALSHMIFEHWSAYSYTGKTQFLGNMLKIHLMDYSNVWKKSCPELLRLIELQNKLCSSYQGIRLSARTVHELEQLRFLMGFGADIKEIICEDPALMSLKQESDPIFLMPTEAIADYDSVLNKDYIVPLYTELSECYFDKELITFSKEDCFVDGGALDLYNSYRFHQKSRGKYKEILAFEPNPEFYQECLMNAGLFDNRLHFSTNALWNQKTELYLKRESENSRCIDSSCACGHLPSDYPESVPVKADSLDNLLTNHFPTFIKLHLEGAELNALKGSKKTIQRCHPKLAVAIGHKKEDIFQIPLEILNTDPTYKLYFRHYSNSITETILFAI